MKSIFILLISTVLFLTACETSNETRQAFKISGQITGLEDSAKITLLSRNNGSWVRHDSTISDGKFEFLGSVNAPELYFVQVGASRSYITMFLENSNVTIDAENKKLDEAEISGSYIHDLFRKFETDRDRLMSQARDTYYELETANASGHEALVDSLAAVINDIYTEIDMVTREHMLKNTDNALGPFLATQVYYNDEELEEADSVMNLFKGGATSNTYYYDFSSNIATWKKVAVGQPALEWTQDDPSGTPVSFSDLSGQYVLIDFWASWCGPCRQENPNVVAMYNDYKDQGFEIIGVSLDDNKEKWIEAIENDGLEWYHVSDLKGWSNQVGDLYGVKAIPHTVLVDKDGVIIAKNLRGDSLRKKLEQLL